jgi:outer membrane protein assembly factor BamB
MTWQRLRVPLVVAQWSGRALVAVAVLAVLWPPTVDWGGRRWGWPVVTVTGLVVVAAVILWNRAVYTPARRRIRPVPAAGGAGATAAVTVLAALALRAVDLPVTADSIFDLVVLAIVAGTVSGLGWMLVATVEDPPEPEPEAPDDEPTGPGTPLGLPRLSGYDEEPGRSRALVVVAVVATVGALLLAPVISDRDTARPLGDLAARGPGDLGRERASFTADGWVSGAGRYLVVDLDGGVEVRDAVTGRPRWHYRDPFNSFSQPLVSADGRTVVVVRPDIDRPTAVAFDLATGARLWSRDLPTERPVNDGFLPLSVVAVGRLVVLFDDDRMSGGGGFAIDVGTGDVRWRVPDAPEPTCRYTDATATATTGTVVVSYQCGIGGDARPSQVVGLSAVDGRTRWTQRSPDGSTLVDVRVSGGQVHVHQLLKAGLCETTVLDADSGTERARFADPTLGCASPVVGDGVTAYTAPAGAVSDQVVGVDQRTGQLRWATKLPAGPAGTVMASLVVGTTAYLVVRAAVAATDVDLAAVDLATGTVNTRRVPLPAGDDPTRRRFGLLPAPGRLVIVCTTSVPDGDDFHTVTIVG